jgi:hypothetical protein
MDEPTVKRGKNDIYLRLLPEDRAVLDKIKRRYGLPLSATVRALIVNALNQLAAKGQLPPLPPVSTSEDVISLDEQVKYTHIAALPDEERVRLKAALHLMGLSQQNFCLLAIRLGIETYQHEGEILLPILRKAT